MSGLNIHVDFVVTTPRDDDSCDEGDYEDEEKNGLDDDEEEIEVEEQEEDSDLVPSITRATKGESYEGYYTDEEEMEVEEEEDNGLVPARAIEGESHELDHDDNYGYDGNDDLVPPITRATNGESCEGYYTDEEEMEVEVEEEDNRLVPARAIEGESHELDHDDNYGYDDLDEDEEQDNGLVPSIRFIPVAKSCVEELEMIRVEEVAKCVICFDDLNAGVRLPCSHIFHANCIHDWLVVRNSCPLCRFQLPSANTSE